MCLRAAEIRTFPTFDRLYRQADEKGLYLEVRPSGGKAWFFKYRIHGTEKRLALGTWPVAPRSDAVLCGQIEWQPPMKQSVVGCDPILLDKPEITPVPSLRLSE